MEGRGESRQLIDGASFGPEILKAIGETFDTVWAEIAGQFQQASRRELPDAPQTLRTASAIRPR
jgi:hypothetical protein